MKQQQFESLYKSEWQAFEQILKDKDSRIKNRGTDGEEDFPQMYTKMCHFLSTAKERRYSIILIEQLNNLVLRGHHHIYSKEKRKITIVIKFFVADFPSMIRKEWKLVLLSLVLFYGSGLMIAGLLELFPELIHSIFNQQQINQFESMYNPENIKLGRERDSDTDLYMFGFYIKHNIGISFQTFAGGILLGIGSLFFLLYNGIVLGAVFQHLHSAGYGVTFFPFVIGHGSFELTAIIFSGAAGLRLGLAIIKPGRLKRIDALKQAAHESTKIIYGVFTMLVIAAFLEAFWSSSSSMGANIKYGVGSILWILLLIYFVFSGRKYGS